MAKPGKLAIPDFKSGTDKPAWLRSPQGFSPTARQSPSPKCAIAGCGNARTQRGYCVDHANQGLSSTQTLTASNRTPQTRHAQNNAKSMFSQTAPLDSRRKHDYPIKKDNEVFRNVQNAWETSWEKFVTRLDNPYAPPTGCSVSYSRTLLEVIMRMCEYVGPIVRSAEWANREESMSGRLATEVIKIWGSSLVANITKEVDIDDTEAIRLIVEITTNLEPSKGSRGDGMEVVVFNRNWVSQLLSAVSMNLTTCVRLYQGGILEGIVKQFKQHILLEQEDLTVQSLLHFLIQSSYVWKVIPEGQYPARDWGRQVGQCVCVVLNPDIIEGGGQASVNSKGRALMAVLVRISGQRCPNNHIEHTRAMLEVPNLIGNIAHWFYERHAMVESFEDVVTEVIREFLANAGSLPAFLQNIVKKALHFGKACAQCGNAAPNQPMTTRCTCKMELYCSRNCQSAHWESGHKQNCKAAWQEEIFNPVGIGDEVEF